MDLVARTCMARTKQSRPSVVGSRNRFTVGELSTDSCQSLIVCGLAAFSLSSLASPWCNSKKPGRRPVTHSPLPDCSATLGSQQKLPLLLVVAVQFKPNSVHCELCLLHPYNSLCLHFNLVNSTNHNYYYVFTASRPNRRVRYRKRLLPLRVPPGLRLHSQTALT